MRYLDIIEAKVDQGKSKLDKIRARTRRKLEPGDRLADKEKSGLRGEAARNSELRRGRLTQASRDEMSSRLRARIRKSVRSATNEDRTIPRQRGGGFSKKTTSSDRRVAPTEKSLEGGGLSRAEYRKRMKKKLKAEAYIQLGDVLAEAMLGEGEGYISPYEGRHLRGKPPTHAEREDMQKTIANIQANSNEADKKERVKNLKTRANQDYRDAEVGEASGKSRKWVKKKSAKAHEGMAKAQEIEGKG